MHRLHDVQRSRPVTRDAGLVGHLGQPQGLGFNMQGLRFTMHVLGFAMQGLGSTMQVPKRSQDRTVGSATCRA